MGDFVKQLRFGRRSSRQGLTLLELAVVIGIMLSLIVALAPIANNVLQQRARKSAANVLLNAFEQARVLALENSAVVYVGFADANIPDSGQGMQNAGFPYTRFIIFGEPSSETNASTPGPQSYIPLTKWLKLPDGISFSSKSPILTGATLFVAKDARFPAINSADYNMPVLKFTNTGMIQTPSTKLWLFIYEGFYADGQDTFTRPNNNNLFERISFSRSTGRAQLDITGM
ncbi:MAG TPA: type II secretion system protein [Chthoniobacterales bacterium]